MSSQGKEPKSNERYMLVVDEVEGFDDDGLNKLYKRLKQFDKYRYPEVKGGDFPKLPWILFDNLTKSQLDLLVEYLPIFVKDCGDGRIHLSTSQSEVYPDKIKIKIGTFFSSDTLEFVKVTGLNVDGVFGDYWVPLEPLTEKIIALSRKQLGQEYDKSDLKSERIIETRADRKPTNEWITRRPGLCACKNCLEISPERPWGFHFGIMTLTQFNYALKRGQDCSPRTFKYPGMNSAGSFNDRFGSSITNNNICLDNNGQVRPYWYCFDHMASVDFGLRDFGHCLLSLRIHSGIMEKIRQYQQYKKEQKRLQRIREEEQRQREEEQQAADAAVLRRQKLMQKMKGNK